MLFLWLFVCRYVCLFVYMSFLVVCVLWLGCRWSQLLYLLMFGGGSFWLPLLDLLSHHCSSVVHALTKISAGSIFKRKLTKLLESVHMDLCRPMQIKSCGGPWCIFSDTFDRIKDYSWNWQGGEFSSSDLIYCCATNDIKRESTNTQSSLENGVVTQEKSYYGG